MLRITISQMTMRAIRFLKYFIFLVFLSSVVYPQENYNIKKILDGVIAYDIKGDKNEVWVATYGSGVFRYDIKKSKWENFSTKNRKLSHDFAYCLDFNKKYVWVGTSDGLFIFDKRLKRWQKRKFGKGGQLSNWIRSIAYDKDLNVVWIGRFKYLTKYDIRRKRFVDYDLTIDGNDKTNTIKSIAADGDSLVWFGTEAGLHKYQKTRRFEEKGAVTFYDNSRAYFNGEGKTVSISKLLFEQDNIWIGLDEFISNRYEDYNLGGVYRFNRGNEWLRFDVDDGLGGNGVYDMELIGNNIWVSLYQFSKRNKEQYGRGVALINRINLDVKVIPDGILPSTIYSIWFDGKKIWLGTNKGIYLLDLDNKIAELTK